MELWGQTLQLAEPFVTLVKCTAPYFLTPYFSINSISKFLMIFKPEEHISSIGKIIDWLWHL